MEEILRIEGFRHLALEIFNKLDFDSVVKKGQLVGRSWKDKMTEEEICLKSAIKWYTGCSNPKLKEILAPYIKKGIHIFFKTFYSILSFKDSYRNGRNTPH